MIKIFFSAFCYLLATSLSYAQFYTEWNKTIYRSKLGSLGGLNNFRIIEANKDRYLISGYTFENDPSGDAWIAFLDCKGDTLWTQSYGSIDREERVSAMIRKANNSFILIGYTTEFGSGNGTIREIDSLGNTLKFNNYGGSNFDIFFDGIIHDNAIYVVGSTRSSNGDIMNNKGNSDIWILKVDLDLNLIWSTTLGGSQSEDSYDINLSSDSKIFVSGRTLSEDGDVSNFNGGFSDAIVSKVDLDGTIIWTKTFGTDAVESFRGIKSTNDGNMLAYGYRSKDEGNDFYVVKMDNNGSILWEVIESGIAYETPQDAIEINGIYYLLGSFYSDVFLEIENHGDSDFILIGYDQNGIRLSAQGFGGVDEDLGTSLIVSTDQKPILFGSTRSSDIHKSNSTILSEVHYWLIKLSDFPVFKPRLSINNLLEDAVSFTWTDSLTIDNYFTLLTFNGESTIENVFGNESSFNNLIPSEYYDIQVGYKGYCEFKYYSDTIRFLTLPVPPEMIFYEYISTSQLLVSWNSVQNVEAYDIDISLDENFQEIVETFEGISETEIIYNSQESIVTDLFIRIRSRNLSGYSRYSDPAPILVLNIDSDPPEVNIFPIPGDEKISIIANHFTEITDIQIHSTNGKQMHPVIQKYSQNEIHLNVSKFPPGLYLVTYSTGNRIFSKKIALK